MPLYEWILGMGAIYFDINPEMGLQAQQDFQTPVYEHLYAIISFFILFSRYAMGSTSGSYVSTHLQVADALSKNLPKPAFELHRDAMGLAFSTTPSHTKKHSVTWANQLSTTS
jgi:hypothetical protein